jgi:2-dehydropantoate 2-reductase
MKISVIGAGAIGALVGGYLAGQGGDVTLIARPAEAAVINRDGLIIDGVRGRKVIRLPAAARLEAGSDLVILAMKTQDIAEAIAANRAALAGALIIGVQNGLRADEIIAQALPGAKHLASIVMFGATYLEPGRVTHNFEGDWLVGGGIMGNVSLEGIVEVLGKALTVRTVADIRGMKWLKLFLNLNNCLPALLGRSMQETFADREMCRLAISLWREALVLVDKAGIELADLPDFPVGRLRGLAGMPLDEAAGIYSGIMTGLSREPLYGSVLQSIKRGRPSEIDYINGEVARLGAGRGWAPLNEKAVNMVHRVEREGCFLSAAEVREGFGVPSGVAK